MSVPSPRLPFACSVAPTLMLRVLAPALPVRVVIVPPMPCTVPSTFKVVASAIETVEVSNVPLTSSVPPLIAVPAL
ncbi:hypothetical protein D3C85_1845440 [compost metagenome]